MKLEFNRRDEKKGFLFKTVDYYLDVTFTVKKDEMQFYRGPRMEEQTNGRSDFSQR